MPYTHGNTTKSIIKKGPESQKLFQEFAVDGTIHVGQPVKLHADGDKVTAFLVSDAKEDCIGISMHPGQSAYGDRVTVAMKGYMIVAAKVSVGETIVPGPVYFDGFDATADENLTGYPLLTTLTASEPFFGWALTGGTAGSILEVVVSA